MRSTRPDLSQSIRQHLAVHGSRRWRLVKSRHRDVPERTFWRAVKRIKEEIYLEQWSIARAEEVDCGDRPGESSLPVKLSATDLLGAYRRVFDGADLLHRFALHADGSIRDARAFDRSLRMHMRILRQSVGLLERVYAVRRFETFMAVLGTEIGREDAVTRDRLLQCFRRAQTAVRNRRAATQSL